MRTPRRAFALSALLCWSFSAPRPANAQTSSLIHSFANDAGQPKAGLVLGDGGVLYGTTQFGGSYGRGSVYTLTPDGLGGYTFAALHSFQGDDGSQPIAALLRGSDGMFYGTTKTDAVAGFGTVFRIDAAGTLTTLHVFDATGGGKPMAALAESSSSLYGTTSTDAEFGNGAAFHIDLSGANFSVLHSFAQSEGTPGRAGVVISGSVMYGTTYLGANGDGLFYSLTFAGVFTPLHDFTISEGQLPDATLVFGSDGALYGTTQFGGQNSSGTVFRVDTAGNLTRLHSFDWYEGNFPAGPLVSASDGKLYGAARAAGLGGYGTFFRTSTAGTFEKLFDFSLTGVSGPEGALLEVDPGVFYGASTFGGGGGFGTVYRVSASGAFELVYEFGMADGAMPRGSLFQDGDDTLWGLTQAGGPLGNGTAFSLAPSGAGFTTVHAFTAAEGSNPIGPPILHPDGNFYAVTTSEAAHQWGTFFRMDPAGAVTTLHDFTAGEIPSPLYLTLADDGNYYGGIFFHVLRIDTSGNVSSIHDFSDPYPSAIRVMQGSDSALYGTTNRGGAFNDGNVFRLALDGTFTTLHDFSLSTDGANLYGGLVEADDGNFYGTATTGGQFGDGFVFRVTPAGQFRIIYSFGAQGSGDATYGGNGLIQGSDGFLYGTTGGGGHSGPSGDGTVFRLDLQGTETVVHSFSQGGGDGVGPLGALLEASDGLLYGTTQSGGQYGGGSVFRIDPAVVVPVLSVWPTSGPAAAGSTVVTVTGLGFQAGASVWMGNQAMASPTIAPTELSGLNPEMVAGTLVHVAVVNPDGSEGSLGRAYLADFLDVPQGNIFHAAVEKILRDGITSGCGSGNYCAADQITRWQMAIFLLKALQGGGYSPPPATGAVFGDVPVDGLAAAWIEDLAARGITAGCGGGDYCPDAPVTRAQMAVFLLKTLLGQAYAPPDPTGTVFGDVPVGAFAAAWIEDLATRGITGGCRASPPLYCPALANTRAQMAAFLVNTFGLP